MDIIFAFEANVGGSNPSGSIRGFMFYVLCCPRRSMDRISPSEGGDASSILAGGIKCFFVFYPAVMRAGIFHRVGKKDW